MHSAAEAALLDDIDLGDDDFRFISRLLQDRTGITLPDHKRQLLCSRILLRLRILGLRRVDQYCALLRGRDAEGEVIQLINAVTTNLTFFFREPHHFDHLRDVALPEFAANAGEQKRLRLWSAGCSSGEEAYSLAMTIAGQAGRYKDWDVRILATDLDSDMVATGRIGCYPADASDSIPPKFHASFVNRVALPSGPVLQMRDDVRQMVSFKPLNLLGDWPIRGPFDAIFCRNVMIYFDRPTKRKLVDRFASLLPPGRFLYIGHSETLIGVSEKFELVGRTIYRRLED